jgi:hypothetical protein
MSAPERAEFEAHARECAECGPLVESVRNLISELQSVEPLEVPPRLVYSVLEQTLGPREHVTFWQSFKKFLAGLATPKFAYGTASVIATLFILLSASGLSLRKPKLSDLNPSNVARNVNRQAHLSYAHMVRYVSDLRVVYEIQSRLRQDENQLPSVPEQGTPKSNTDKPSDDHTRTQPKQQNRADDIVARQFEMLAQQCPVVLDRSYR